jgi:hypothetical protein
LGCVCTMQVSSILTWVRWETMLVEAKKSMEYKKRDTYTNTYT